MFQFRASVADSGPVFNQYCVFGVLKPFKRYNYNNSCNSIQTQNVEMLGASVSDSDTTLSQQRDMSMCDNPI